MTMKQYIKWVNVDLAREFITNARKARLDGYTYGFLARMEVAAQHIAKAMEARG